MAKPTHNDLTTPAYLPRYRICLVAESRHTGPLVMLHDSTAAAKALLERRGEPELYSKGEMKRIHERALEVLTRKRK